MRARWFHAWIALFFAVIVLLSAGPVHAEHRGPAEAGHATRDAMETGKHAFCTHPPTKLKQRDADLCPLARELPDCKAFVDACDHLTVTKKEKEDAAAKSEPSASSPHVPAALATVAQVAVIGIIIAVVLLLLVPILLAFFKSRKDAALADIAPDAPQAAGAAPEPIAIAITDAERLLMLAQAHAQKGEYKEALGTYLTACLRALDHRGLIRFARHRTNGEYVRTCEDSAARAELAKVVREVEAAEFGGAHPDADSITRVARAATALVRGAAMFGVLVLTLVLGAGCGGQGAGTRTESDPAGMQLLIDVLSRQGIDAAWLPSSLGSMPIASADEVAPVVIVDFSEVHLDDEARDHLRTWIEAGGVLVAISPTADEEELLAVKTHVSSAHEVAIDLPHPYSGKVTRFSGKVGSTQTLEPHAKDVPGESIGTETTRIGTTFPAGTFALKEPRGEGAIITVGSVDPFTNIGMRAQGNAELVSAIIEHAFGATISKDTQAPIYLERPVRIARSQDGMTPPSNPLSALDRAGLGLGMWHVLPFVVILFFAVGVRRARPKPEPPPTRRAFAEHADATGGLYARAQVAQHARAAFAKYVDERVRARAGKAFSTDDEETIKSATGISAEEYKDLVSPISASIPAELERMRKLRRVLAAATSYENTKSPAPTAKETS